jgi:hypothetical protein
MNAKVNEKLEIKETIMQTKQVDFISELVQTRIIKHLVARIHKNGNTVILMSVRDINTG